MAERFLAVGRALQFTVDARKAAIVSEALHVYSVVKRMVASPDQCPWHNSELALDDGHVVNGPATFPARCFDVRVREGQIEVRAASKRAAG